MSERGRRRTLVGRVVSTKMDKTAIVAVERRISHRLYKKIMRRTNRYKAHDERNEARLGDMVRIIETRPLSKDKHWRIGAFLTRGNVAEVAPRDIGVPEEAIATRIEPPVTEASIAEPPVTAAPIAEAPVAAAPVAEASVSEAVAAEVAAPAEPVAEAAAEPESEPEAGEEEPKA